MRIDELNMLSGAIRCTGPSAVGFLVDLQLAPGELLESVGFALGHERPPLVNGALGHAEDSGDRGLRFEVRDHIGFTHLGRSLAC
jgi:hypothetical protein